MRFLAKYQDVLIVSLHKFRSELGLDDERKRENERKKLNNELTLVHRTERPWSKTFMSFALSIMVGDTPLAELEQADQVGSYMFGQKLNGCIYPMKRQIGRDR